MMIIIIIIIIINNNNNTFLIIIHVLNTLLLFKNIFFAFILCSESNFVLDEHEPQVVIKCRSMCTCECTLYINIIIIIDAYSHVVKWLSCTAACGLLL